ncbi:MAG: TspO/MBR family protein [Pseudomonadota bacterium]
MSLLVFIALVFIAALSGAIFRPGDWYEGLRKPSWNPPNWMFPTVWTALYAMIAAAGWIVWQEAGLGLAIGLWGLQLVLNAAWSVFFFGMRRMDLAFFEVCLLWLSIAAFMGVALPISPLAAALFVPYLVWVTIAAALNLSVWRMNPGAEATAQ